MDIGGLSISSRSYGSAKSNASAPRRGSFDKSSSRKSTSPDKIWKLEKSQSKSDENNLTNESSSYQRPEATRIFRAKSWNQQVEEAFRVQQTGWKDIHEYKEAYGEPERWDNGLIKCTRVKKSGYYTYWRRERECDEKYLKQVKLFEYAYPEGENN